MSQNERGNSSSMGVVVHDDDDYYDVPMTNDSVLEPRNSMVSSMSVDSGGSSSHHVRPPSTPRQPQHAESGLSSSSPNKPSSKQHLSSNDCVKVAVRIRPLLSLEAQESCLTILDEPSPMMEEETVATSVRVGPRRTGVTYTFDCVYGATTSQARLYQHSVVPLLNACLEGYNATILAYGQTGSGKTHTILGNHVTGDLQGVLPRTIHALFDALQETSTGACDSDDPDNPQSSTTPKTNTNRPCDEWKVQIQFLEIYGEDIRDLLRPGGDQDSANRHHNSDSNNRTKVTIRDGGHHEEPEVLGAVQPQVYSAQECLQILQTGRLRRVTAATAMNATSSRSHALFTLSIEQTWHPSKAAAAASATITRKSKFHFVDLAGSERAKRTQAVGQRLKEGIEINKGLLVLGNVIAALAASSKSGQTFVPYRDSKLTRLLRGSLGGNHKTLMIACVSPSADNLEESLNCLRYANRAKQIQNKATINLDPTSHYIMTLQQHVAKLAQQALSNDPNSPIPPLTHSYYTLDQLQALAGGESMERVLAGIQTPDDTTSAGMHTPVRPRRHDSAKQAVDTITTTTAPALQPIEIPKDDAEESLYWQKAQTSMHQVWHSNSSSANDAHRGSASDQTDQEDTERMDLMMQKMVEYEREIGELKKALAVERSQRAMIQEEQSWMDEVQRSLQDDRFRLERISGAVIGDHDADEDDEESGLQRIDAEHEAEQKALQTWTKKYATDGEDNEDEDGGDHVLDDGEDSSAAPSGSTGPMTPPPSKHREIQADLMNLAKSIAAKEELIGQLKASQERYEMMREFYEAKLKEMEQHLVEKEEERESLLKKLDEAQHAKAGGLKSQELRDKLREKEEHIATLKKKSAELRNLTSVSSRNSNEIARLMRDVEEMKRRKVDMQKLLTVERKNHANAIKRLQKEAMHKERELSKYKRLTSQREMEAEKANQIAKTRLAELGALRQKYRDTEKKLRMQSVKRGVMAKAGLDPVLVGKRDNTKHNIDTNALRDLFDEKVSKVARKEALVNKLAEEWEQHFQLSSKRDEVAKSAESPEDLENIELQLKYKEDRIRNLAKRLEKERGIEDPRDKRSADSKESFLFDAQFEKVCKTAPSDVAHKSLAKVLFGMVVRERRRVAALARTACSLDERLQTATEDLEAKELALRSYVDEQRAQVAEITQNQQNQILSLMELVKEDHSHPKRAAITQGPDTAEQSDDFDETLLILANERISLLEQQLENMTAEAEAAKSYNSEVEETKETLQQVEEENRVLHEELEKVNSEIRKLKTMLVKTPGRGIEVARVMAAVDKVLSPDASDDANRKPAPAKKVRSLPESIIDLDESEPEDGNSSTGEPEWANEIMDDLALIAEGKIPPSLKGTPDYEEQQSAVFERLADPGNYTGTQAQKAAQIRNRSSRQRMRNSTPNSAASSYSREADDNKGTERPAPAARPRSLRTSSRLSSRSSSGGVDPSAPVGKAERISSPAGRVPRPSQVSRREESIGEQQENVFDRLSNQQTFSFAVKHNGAPEEEQQHHAPRMTSVDALLDEVLGVTPYNGHSSPDVFERLTKTTTEAYAMKRK